MRDKKQEPVSLTVVVPDPRELLRVLELLCEAAQDAVDEIDSLERRMTMTVRTSNCLRAARITTLQQLCARTQHDLLGLPGLGRKSLREIEEVLASLGLHLAA